MAVPCGALGSLKGGQVVRGGVSTDGEALHQGKITWTPLKNTDPGPHSTPTESDGGSGTSFPLSRFCYFEKYQTCREIKSKVQGTLGWPSPRFTNGEHFGTFPLFFLPHSPSPWQAAPKNEGRTFPPQPQYRDRSSE